MFRKFWFPIILKSIVMVEAITGLDGPSKKQKAGALAVAFSSLLGEGFTQSNVDEVDNLIDETVLVLNNEGVFETHGQPAGEHAETEPESEPEPEPETEPEPEPEHELVEWPLKGYSAEVYLNRWPKGQYAELARKLLNR